MQSAILSAGLSYKAIVDGMVDHSSLSAREKLQVLKFLGQPPTKKDPFGALFGVACNSQKEIERIVSSSGVLPVINKLELYIRKSYIELYKHIEKPFLPDFVIIGTSGVGKSTFLVYVITRLLVTSKEPPIVIFHTRGDINAKVLYSLTSSGPSH